ncbi:hypothetical protein AX17_007167 [Amanita inopinata Kibby_2008]|nr:hypothetical protein AX17_007167 [Amanita inopinata Kibby_2008]
MRFSIIAVTVAFLSLAQLGSTAPPTNHNGNTNKAAVEYDGGFGTSAMHHPSTQRQPKNAPPTDRPGILMEPGVKPGGPGQHVRFDLPVGEKPEVEHIHPGGPKQHVRFDPSVGDRPKKNSNKRVWGFPRVGENRLRSRDVEDLYFYPRAPPYPGLGSKRKEPDQGVAFATSPTPAHSSPSHVADQLRGANAVHPNKLSPDDIARISVDNERRLKSRNWYF